MSQRREHAVEYSIELARPGQLEALPAIERTASALFPDRVIPADVRTTVVPREQMEAAQADGRLWVAATAGGAPVGFAIVMPVERSAFLFEIDVHPDHQRQGLGERLIRAVIDWAAAGKFASVSLTTFEHLPWNAPFYERLGFRRLGAAELSDDLRRRLQNEHEQGLRERVAMQLDLAP